MSSLSFIKDLLAGKSIHSLSMKLIIAIGGLIFIGSLTFWYSIIYTGKEEMIKNTASHAKTYINLIKKSSYYNMLTNNTEAIQKTFESMVSEEGFIGIRVFDLTGRIIFSSDARRINKTVSVTSVTCGICHGNIENPSATIKFSRSSLRNPQWIILEEGDDRIMKSVVPIFNEPSCYTASCHYHKESQKALGILETDYSLKDIDTKIRQQNVATATFGILFTAFTSVVLCIILWQIAIRPLLVLSEGMKSVSKGDLDHRININTKDEIGMLARNFNSMTKELKNAREKLENWAKELEDEVKKKTEEIRKGQEQYIHTEKLASLGRMAAGVAHEINSPLTGIVTFAHLMLQRIPEENKMDREDIEVIIEQAERCSKIIKGLLGFSRAIPSEKTEMNINETLRHTIGIIRNQAKFHNVKIELQTDDALPFVRGDSSQIEQVFLNLLINAADAMNDKGKIFIRTSPADIDGTPYFEVEISDTGPGIPEEYASRLFEPFFTTKPVGKGTGLGLAVSHGIIKKHGGHIAVRNRREGGTTFFVRVPIRDSTHNTSDNDEDDNRTS